MTISGPGATSTRLLAGQGGIGPWYQLEAHDNHWAACIYRRA